MAILEVTDLEKTYPTGERALKGVNLSLDGSDVISLLGRSGSGKSTLLRCLNRLVEPDAGRVHFNGWDITSLSSGELRRARRDMGMVFQEFNLVERLTVLENVLCGLLGSTSTWRSLVRAFPREGVDKAIATCESVGLLDHIGKRADQLSGGQRQRVGIARAVMQDPKLLLADEPISSLDPNIGNEVMELLVSLAKEHGIPMIVSVHDLDLAIRCSDRVVALNDGMKVLDAETATVEAESLSRVYGLSPT